MSCFETWRHNVMLCFFGYPLTWGFTVLAVLDYGEIVVGIHPVWSESSLSAWRSIGSLATHKVHSEGSDQTRRCPGWSESLLGTHIIWLVLSCGGSNNKVRKGKNGNDCIRMRKALSKDCHLWRLWSQMLPCHRKKENLDHTTSNYFSKRLF